MAELSRAIRAEHREVAFRRLGESIVYLVTNDVTNRSTGVVTSSDTVYPIESVLTSEMDPLTVQRSGGQFQPGDRWFRIQASDMPEDPPSLTSEIYYPATNGKNYSIVQTLHSSDGNVWDILGRKV